MSRVGETAAVEIEVMASEGARGPLGVRLLLPEEGAGAQAAATRGLDLRATLEQRGPGKVVRITSLKPLARSDLKVMVELRWSSGVRLAEYLLRFPDPAAQSAEGAGDDRASAVVVKAVEENPPIESTQEVIAASSTVPSATAPADEAAASGGRWTVKPGDRLNEIAKATRHARVSLQQMSLAIFRANPDAFQSPNSSRLIVGKVLTIPDQQTAAAISPAEALAFYAAQFPPRRVNPAAPDLVGYSNPQRPKEPPVPAAPEREAPDQGAGKAAAIASVAQPNPADPSSSTAAHPIANLSGAQGSAIEKEIAELQQSLGVSGTSGTGNSPHAAGSMVAGLQARTWLIVGVSGVFLLLLGLLGYRQFGRRKKSRIPSKAPRREMR